jgi:hypothetical protein
MNSNVFKINAPEPVCKISFQDINFKPHDPCERQGVIRNKITCVDSLLLVLA